MDPFGTPFGGGIQHGVYYMGHILYIWGTPWMRGPKRAQKWAILGVSQGVDLMLFLIKQHF